MAVVDRHKAGSTGDWTVDNGFVYREQVLVSGLSGANIGEALYQAFIDPSLPQFNDTLVFGVSPNDVTLYCQNRSLRRVDWVGGLASQMAFELTWQQFVSAVAVISNEPSAPDDDGAGVATIGSVVEVVQTEFDKNGAEITLQASAASPAIIQPVQYRRPRPVQEFQRWENTSPRTRAETFVGKLNLGVWNGFADGTVLCTGVVGSTRDRGATYDVKYDFEIDLNGWDTTVVYISEHTGRPISPLVDGVSKKTISLYQKVSFAPLNITL